MKKFNDVSRSDWFYEYVCYVADRGYMIGVSETEFAPRDNMTVSMIDVAMNRMIKQEIPFNHNTPESNRIETIRAVCKFVGDHFHKSFRIDGELPFTDTSSLSAADKNYAKALYNAGIIIGDDMNCLRPYDKLQRCEFAAIMMRLDQWLKK